MMRDIDKRQAGADFLGVRSNVVYLPESSGKPALEGDVEQLNLFGFYEVGGVFSRVTRYEGDTSASACMWDVFAARRHIIALLNGVPFPLGVSKGKARDLHEKIHHIYENHFTEPKPDGTRELKFPGPADPPIYDWEWTVLRNALNDFETVFREEMREAAAYFVPRRGIYWTPALVDTADESFPRDIVGFIPDKTRADWRAAGRCLAFNLLTASGFHVARAVEGTIESYYQLFSGTTDTLVSWGEYLKKLEEIRAKKPTPAPSEKTLTEIQQMKDDYRNPIAHPRIVLEEADARMLFANGESLIIAMAQEIREVAKTKGGIQQELAVVGGGRA